MYKVIQYYEYKGGVKPHIVIEEETFEAAYMELLNIYNDLKDYVVIVNGLSKENIDYIVLEKLEKGKDLFTIVN